VTTPRGSLTPSFGLRLRRAFGAGLLLAGAGLVLLSGVVHCPIALVLGVPCPGCGTTRAARALLACDFSRAFRIQPAAPIVVLALALLAARGVWLVAREGHARSVSEGKFGRALIGALLASALLELCVWTVRWFGLLGGPLPV